MRGVYWFAMLVSAVIPTYNRIKDLLVAIESALGQTHKNLEILVCDDGSTDDTARVLAARYGDRIRYLPKPNGGVSSARNWGIARANGEAVALLDSDDEWMPEKIAEQVAILKTRPQIDMVLTGSIELDDARRPTGVVLNRRRDYPHDGHILRYVVRSPALYTSTAMVRTSVAREVGAFDTQLPTAEDLDFHLKIARRSQIAVIERPMMKYIRYADAKNSLSSLDRTYHDYVFVLERFLTKHQHELSKDDVREAYVRTYIKNARGLAGSDVMNAARFSLKSLPHVRRPTEAAALAKIGVIMGRQLARNAVKRVGGL